MDRRSWLWAARTSALAARVESPSPSDRSDLALRRVADRVLRRTGLGPRGLRVRSAETRVLFAIALSVLSATGGTSSTDAGNLDAGAPEGGRLCI